MALPSPVGCRKLSCFSAVRPVIGWNRCVKCVAPFSMAQSFMAAATVSAIVGIERRALLDGLLQRLEDRLGQPFALDGFAEDILSEQVLHVGFLEVDLLELVLGGGDGLQGGVARIRGTHSVGYSNQG